MIFDYMCYVIFFVFFAWVAYIQIVGWRRTKGYRMTMEMDLMDRFHEEVIYQLCYKRGYHVTMDMNEDAYWQITETDHPNRKWVKFIVFLALVKVAIMPFSYRTNRNPDFDDYDKKWNMPEDISDEDYINLQEAHDEEQELIDFDVEMKERDSTEVVKEMLDTAE